MAIKFHIKTKDIDLTTDIENLITDKLGSIDKFLKDDSNEEALAEVEVGLITRGQNKGDIYMAEINLSYKGKLYRASIESDDISNSIDSLKDAISKEVRRSEGKKSDMFRKGGRMIKKLLRLE